MVVFFYSFAPAALWCSACFAAFWYKSVVNFLEFSTHESIPETYWPSVSRSGWFVEYVGQSFFRLEEVPVSSCNLCNKGGIWVGCSDQGDTIGRFPFSGL